MHDRPTQLAERLTRRLAEGGVRFHVHEHVVSRTVADAEALLPFPLEGLLKTVVFRVKGGPWVLAACRGQDRVDYRKLALACGTRRADLVQPAPEEVEAALGFAIGGVSPLPPDDATLVIVDATAAATLDTVYCGIGRNDRTLEIAIADLIAVAGARVLPIVQEA
jgi:Cys-tRNA(Pro)/Cys-tRNA(Cys) deacylase